MTHLLMIDPNPVLRREALLWSTESGYPTQVVRTVEDALEDMPTSVDVVVLNVENSLTQAERMIRMLKQDERTATLPLLVCTWSTQIQQLAKWVLLGADRTLQHPIERPSFLQALAALIGRESAQS
tara:strand:+ start:9531 stop:9908 length:378 start_codon:yes stop_codon:yes gene_type:complete